MIKSLAHRAGLICLFVLSVLVLTACSGYDSTPTSVQTGVAPATTSATINPPEQTNGPIVSNSATKTAQSGTSATTSAASKTPARTTPATTSRSARTEQGTDPTGQENTRLIETWLAGTPATIYIPESLKPQQAIQLVVAVHGMHGKGAAICNGLISFAEQNGVVLLAPTFNYSDNYFDPQVVAPEDSALSQQLIKMVTELGNTTHIRFKNRMLFYGFSRGAQLVHRFALMYPDKTLGVAALSAGSYTLPYQSYDAKGTQPMPFHFGVGDLVNYTSKPFDRANFAKVNFLIEVGALDNDPEQASRAWDNYGGRTRLERAQSFYQILKQIGVKAQFESFPGVGHQETPAMRDNALKFFKSLTAQGCCKVKE